MAQVRRRPIAYMSYTKRRYGICAKEAKMIRRGQRWRRRILGQYIAARTARQDEATIRALHHALLHATAYLNVILTVEINEPLAAVLPARTIESFSDSECWRRFRMRKNDLYRVKNSLAIPHTVRLSNGSRFSGEEVLLFSLNRFTTCGWIHDLIPVFGRDVTQWTRAFHWFIKYMIANFAYLLTDMLQFWKPYIPLMAEKIRRKLHAKHDIYFPPGTFRVFGFIDCTVIASLRPGGGPTSPGPNAERCDNFIQMAFYNGWKKHHGTKFQSIELPNGMCMHMYGPKSFRNCDLSLLASSGIIGKIRHHHQILDANSP